MESSNVVINDSLRNSTPCYNDDVNLFEMEKDNPVSVVTELPLSKSTVPISHKVVHTEPVEPSPAPWVNRNHPSDVVLGNCCTQLMWMKQMLRDYGVFENTFLVYCDNMSAMCLAKNPIQHTRTKHIDIRHHFIRDLVEDGILKLTYFISHAKHQLADLLTKPLDSPRFEFLRKSIESSSYPLIHISFTSYLFAAVNFTLFQIIQPPPPIITSNSSSPLAGLLAAHVWQLMLCLPCALSPMCGSSCFAAATSFASMWMPRGLKACCMRSMQSSYLRKWSNKFLVLFLSLFSVQAFYEGLNDTNKSLVDSGCGGVLMEKSSDEAIVLFETLSENSQQFSSRGRQGVKGKGVYEVSTNDGLDILVKAMSAQNISQVQQVAKIEVCAICSHSNHTTETCPMSCFTDHEQANYVGQNNYHPKNNPYSNTYNPGWKDHPNFSWSNSQNNNNLEGAILQFLTAQQQTNALTSQNIQKLEATTSQAIQRLEAQVGQLAKELSERKK
ncbi:unnamed protein product [Prunus brigantina]